MDFFAAVDALGIVERHVQGVLALEESEASRLLKRYREVRIELRDRLDRFPDGTFSAQQLRGVLVQVDAAIIAMAKSLKSGMQDAAFGSAMRGVEDQVSEIAAFSEHFEGAVVPINLNAQLVALDAQNFLINRHEASLEAYSEAIRAGLVQALTTQSLAQAPLSSVVRSLGAYFQGEEWKLHRIARTELHNVYGLGKIRGMTQVRDSALPDLMKTLYHPMDDRTGKDSKYAARLELVVPLEKPFKYRWKGETRVYMNPPDRPNDRSIVMPYRRAWDS